MDSSTLLELGFCKWRSFVNGVQQFAPEDRGVYAFRSLNPTDLTLGSSDIVYMGRAMSDRKGPYHNIRHSLGEYLHPGNNNRTKARVGQRALAEGWQVSWMRFNAPDQIECQLLHRFHEEHGQLPPENKVWPPQCGPHHTSRSKVA